MFYEVRVFHLKKKKENKMTELPCNLHFFISKLWILSGPLILCCSLAGSCWLWRWKTLVWLLSKTPITLNVTCIAEPFFTLFHAQYGGDDQKDQNQRRSSNMSALRETTMPTLRPTWGAFNDCPLVNFHRGHCEICACPFENILVVKNVFLFIYFSTPPQKQPLKKIRLSASKRYSIIKQFSSIPR